MPKPIEPSPMTAMRGFAESACGILECFLTPCSSALALGITAWPRCQSMGQSGNRDAAMTETKLREEICRLGRSLFERGLTPGSSGNISVRLDDGGWLVTPTNASLGSLDPARLSRLDADGKLVSGDAPTKEVPLHTRAVPDAQRRARRGASAFDPFGGAVDAAGDRSARRVAADDALLPDEMRRDRAGAVLSARRSGGRRRHQGAWPGNIRRCCWPITARWCRATTLEAAVFAIEELEETAKLYLLLRGLNPRYLYAGAGGGFGEASG